MCFFISLILEVFQICIDFKQPVFGGILNICDVGWKLEEEEKSDDYWRFSHFYIFFVGANISWGGHSSLRLYDLYFTHINGVD